MVKKDTVFWLAASAAVMLAFPWLAVTFAKGDAGMAACFLLLYGVNPIYSAIVGAFAGKEMSRLWRLPILSAALFLIGAWAFWDMGEMAFFLYAVVYLAFGTGAMSLSALRG